MILAKGDRFVETYYTNRWYNTFEIHAREDDVTSIKNASYIAAHIGGHFEKVLLENSYHMITLDQERDLVADYSIDFIRRTEQAVELPHPGDRVVSRGTG